MDAAVDVAGCLSAAHLFETRQHFVERALRLDAAILEHQNVVGALHGRLCEPYLLVSDETIQRFRRRVEEVLPDLVWRP